MSRKISVANYLFSRLRQLGVESVHGVPGDFFLKALDHLKPASLKWIGNCNELNAGYAADGYARVKGISALFTTFGVGEMSAFNAVAGSYAEHAPVVHIVGTPNRRIQRAKAMVHHSLGDGNMRIFMDMFKNVTVAQADLQDSAKAPSQIDWVLEQALLKRRPVYVGLPSDVVPEAVPAELLEQPLNVEEPMNDSTLEGDVANLVIQKITEARQPLILVDGLCEPFGIAESVNGLVKATKIPTMCFPFGKGIVDESFENFYGVHAGQYGRVDNTAYTSNADLVLLFGPLLSDNNTTGFTTVPDPKVTISFHLDKVEIPGGRTHQLRTKPLLDRILRSLQSSNYTPPPPNHYRRLRSPATWLSTLSTPNPSSPITQDHFYAHLSPFLRPHDHILLANGTPLPGGRDLILPHPTRILSSSIFLSVGHWLPASQGVSLALRELAHSNPKGGGRTILLEGDGSFQATGQELSTIIRHRLDVIIFLMNNGGYTYERLIHGMREEYNDVPGWRYLEAPRFFGAPDQDDDGYPVRTYQIRTWGELDDVLGREEVRDARGLTVVEVLVESGDVPGRLGEVLTRAGRALEE